MKRNILNKLACLLLLSLFFSCRVKKEGVLQAPVVQPVSTVSLSKDAILDSIPARQANFNTLSIRAKAKLVIDKDDNDVSMIMRIQKDKAIWVSISAIAGLEVARALVTPDSIKIINRLENNYIKKPFSYIYDFTNKQLNFNTLQAILVGNAMPEFLNDKAEVTRQDKTTTVSGVLVSLVYALIFNENLRVEQADLKDEKAGQTLKATYGDFISVSQQIIPQSLTIRSVAANKNISIDLNYNRVEMNVPVDFPFNIPQRFKLKD